LVIVTLGVTVFETENVVEVVKFAGTAPHAIPRSTVRPTVYQPASRVEVLMVTEEHSAACPPPAEHKAGTPVTAFSIAEVKFHAKVLVAMLSTSKSEGGVSVTTSPAVSANPSPAVNAKCQLLGTMCKSVVYDVTAPVKPSITCRVRL